MSELEREPSEAEGVETQEELSLEQALQQNFAAASEPDSGDAAGGDAEVEVEAEAEEQPESEVQESESEPLEPLETWSEERKEYFKTLDRQAQEFLLERHKEFEADYTKKSQELAEQRKKFEKLDEVLKPYDEVLRQRGIDIAPHVANALQYYFAYQQDPVSTVRNLIQSQGLTQDQIFEDDSDVDPTTRALRERLDKTERELAELKRQPTPDQSQAQRELESFKSATDEQGNPKHPYFEQVKHLMAPLVNEGKSLEDAYDQVVWSLPEFRKSQLEAERKKAQKEAEAKRAEKAKKAKSASEVMPSSDVDKSTGKTDFSGWDKALHETLNQLGG